MKSSVATIALAVGASACLLASACGDGSPTHPDRIAAVGTASPTGGLASTASNRVPVMKLSTTPRAVPGTPHPVVAGSVPLTVRFNLCGSSDPDQNAESPAMGDTLNWQFHFGESGQAFNGDGTFNADVAQRCRTEHTYARVGRYVATASVTDKHLEDQSHDVAALARVTERLTIEVGPERPSDDPAGPPPCGGDGECTVFLTSSKHNGNLGGLSGADAICQGLARSAGLPGTFLAWLSDEVDDPSSRFPSRAPLPYVRTDGTRVAASWNDLTDGTLAAAISSDEFGNLVGVSGLGIWTNTRSDGRTRGNASDTCDGWTSDSVAVNGAIGTPVYTDHNWTELGLAACRQAPGDRLRLYCFEQ